MTSRDEINLSGDGAAYIRVSDDEQDTERQRAAIQAFLQRLNAGIAENYWFEDEGWARDTAERRPDFQRLLKLAEAGVIKWIVVSERDRFATTDADEFMHYRYLLRRWGCHLYDVSGKDWTGDDIATVIHAVVEGDRSKEDQHLISKRVLEKGVVKARNGERRGGPVRLGFDVACFAFAEPDKERWRVIFEDLDKRLKVYPDGRTERFDGPHNFPPHNKEIEFKQLVPSRDQAKIDAAVSVFKRYATESIGFANLARYLNDLGFRSCYGGEFQGCQIEEMLADPAYIGWPVGNREHNGKFHRYKDGQAVREANPQKKQTKNDKADWIHCTRQLFAPLVDPQTWAAVQEKLANQARRVPAPRCARHYLAGLVYCAQCGARMAGGPGRQKRLEYFCGTYFWYCRKKRAKDSPCQRNGVLQEELEVYINRYLDETGQRLDLLLQGRDDKNDPATSKMEEQAAGAWKGFTDGLQRLCDYLMRYHPQEYATILEEDQRRAVAERAPYTVPPPGSFRKKYGKRFQDAANKHKGDPVQDSAALSKDFVGDLIQSYRANFDRKAVAAEIDKLDAEHTALTQQCLKLTSALAIDKTNKQLADLEKRIEALRQQQKDAAAVVEEEYRRLNDLQAAIASAKMEMTSRSGERSWRRKAAALRKVIQRIECAFTTEGIVYGPHGGRRQSRLVTVKIYPVSENEAVEYSASAVDNTRTLLPYRGVSRR